VANAAHVNAIGLAPSNGRIGVCARNRISASADSGSGPVRAALRRHKDKVVKSSQYAAIPRAPERDFGHPPSLIANIVGTDTDGGEHVTQRQETRSRAVALPDSE
jgi:hypothetical protein